MADRPTPADTQNMKTKATNAAVTTITIACAGAIGYGAATDHRPYWVEHAPLLLLTTLLLLARYRPDHTYVRAFTGSRPPSTDRATVAIIVGLATLAGTTTTLTNGYPLWTLPMAVTASAALVLAMRRPTYWIFSRIARTPNTGTA